MDRRQGLQGEGSTQQQQDRHRAISPVKAALAHLINRVAAQRHLLTGDAHRLQLPSHHGVAHPELCGNPPERAPLSGSIGHTNKGPVAELLQRATDLFDWLGSGELKVRIDKTFPLAEAAEAHRYLESRRAMGKILLRP